MQLSWLEPQDTEQPEIGDLTAVGVLYEHLEVDERSFQPTLDRLKAERGYVEQDEVELTAATPDLDGVCAKFADEHLHTDDEVRFVLRGSGIFDIRDQRDRWMRVQVDQGDLLVVPANLHHRFFLTDEKDIRCVRLFKDRGGWVPHYRTETKADA